MKNYLIKGLHRIGSTKWWPGYDREHEGDLYSHYTKMNALSEASFRHYLMDDWELINLVSDAVDINHVFRQQFQAIYEIWSKEPCNILYCGADTQMLRPTRVFHKYNHFLLWNYTDPKIYGPCGHFLNADIRYYPASMRKETWDWALSQIKDLTWWNSDQVLYNMMVWGQGLGHKEVIDPKMAYQGFMLPQYSQDLSDEWNGCKLQDANIVHWHGSRGAEQKLAIMQSVNDQAGAVVRVVPTQTIDISYIK